MLYLDASAITKLVIDEADSQPLRARVGGKAWATSRIAVVEVRKAVSRVNPSADPGPILRRLAFVELDPELAELAGALGGPGLRSLDAIHLASALRLGPALEAFVTYDARQAVAARSAGLPVEAPGAR